MDKVRLTIEKLIWRGRGLAHLPSGQVALVEPGVYPGEEIEGLIHKAKRDYVEVSWTDVIKPHDSRRPHPCLHSRGCGGCRFGTIPQSVQLCLKKELLLNEIKRALGDETIEQVKEKIEIFPSRPGWRYRWRGQVVVYKRKPHFRQIRSHQLIPLDDCLLFSRPLSKSLKQICQRLPEGKQTVAASPFDHLALPEHSTQSIRLPLEDYGLMLDVPPKVFFQANWSLNLSLIRYVCKHLMGLRIIADLYAGVGNFSLPLSRQADRVMAIGSDSEAIIAARENAETAGLNNVEFINCDVVRADLPRLLVQYGIQALVFDPPRIGIGKGLNLVAEQPVLERIVWISCDIVNTCRDIRPFIKAGWIIKEMALFDMFPQTWHIEVVFVLEKERG